MTLYEIGKLIITLGAFMISVISLYRTHRLQKVTAELRAKQLQIIEREEKQNAQADIHADLVHEGGADYSFLITNVGSVSAKDVQFELRNCPNSPLVSGDYDHKLPAPILNPRGKIRLIAAIHMGSPSAFTALVSWTDPDGRRRLKEFYLTL